MPEITETKLKEQIAKEQIGSLYFFCTATKNCSCAAI